MLITVDHVKLALGTRIMVDHVLEELFEEFFSDYSCIVVPGGTKGTQTMLNSPMLLNLLRSFKKDKLVCAICAAPLVLEKAGVLKTIKSFTCYPSLENEMESKEHYVNQDVVVDQNVITGQGPAKAISFALKIVEVLAGAESAACISKAMLC